MHGATLTSPAGISALVAAGGAHLHSLQVPATDGAAELLRGGYHRAGATIGRYANRIAGGTFELDGQTYELSRNEGRNTIHGGASGFDSAVWNVAEQGASHIRLSHVSPDGDQGFPGELRVDVTFALRERSLQIAYRAVTDKPTILNLTNHAYFNLRGAGSIEEHTLQIFASRYTPLDDEKIPTGAIAAVANTEFDFRTARHIGTRPYDANFVLDGSDESLRRAAVVSDAATGRALTVYTTEPGLQLYTADGGACTMETQHFADSPHHPGFPSTVLRPGDVFESRTVFELAW